MTLGGTGNRLHNWAIVCVALTEPGMEGASETRTLLYLLNNAAYEISVFVDFFQERVTSVSIVH